MIFVAIQKLFEKVHMVKIILMMKGIDLGKLKDIRLAYGFERTIGTQWKRIMISQNELLGGFGTPKSLDRLDWERGS